MTFSCFPCEDQQCNEISSSSSIDRLIHFLFRIASVHTNKTTYTKYQKQQSSVASQNKNVLVIMSRCCLFVCSRLQYCHIIHRLEFFNEQTNTKAEPDTSTISTPRKLDRPQLSHANQPLLLQHKKMGDIVLLLIYFFTV